MEPETQDRLRQSPPLDTILSQSHPFSALLVCSPKTHQNDILLSHSLIKFCRLLSSFRTKILFAFLVSF
jgi:hypothetical protein